MTLEKAIKLLNCLQLPRGTVHEVDTHQAIQLAIEALKRCRNFRENSQTWGYNPLPGETEE